MGGCGTLVPLFCDCTGGMEQNYEQSWISWQIFVCKLLEEPVYSLPVTSPVCVAVLIYLIMAA